jgi:hypothetical protein
VPLRTVLTEDDALEEENEQLFSFEILKEKLAIVKQKCIEIDIPLVEGY